jgi:hypothetical protein
MDQQVNFQRSRQGSITPPTATVTTTGQPIPEEATSYPGNTLIVSPFIELQTNKTVFWKPIVMRPPLVTTNLASLPQYLGGTPATKGTDFYFLQKRTYSLGWDGGTRYEGSDLNYFELGYTHQKSYDVLSSVFVPGKSPCPLIDKSTLKSCAGTFAATPGAILTATYNNYSQNGAYWLGMTTFGLTKTLLVQSSTFGTFFGYGSHSASTALTHYAVEMTNSPQYLVYKTGITLGPTYNLFFFQANARHTIGASLTRRDLGAQVNYLFNWHAGMSVRDALRGKSQ